MKNILQQRATVISNKFEGPFAEIEFELDTQRYLKDIIHPEKFKDESTLKMLKDTINELSTTMNFSREKVAKDVAENLGVSIVEFLSMPTETVDKFLSERKLILQNETINKFNDNLKDKMTSLGILKNPEIFDSLEFISRILVLANN